MRRRLSLGLLCLTLAGCARQADIIVTGGMLWTGLSNGAPQKGAVALANGKIRAVGASGRLARYGARKAQGNAAATRAAALTKATPTPSGGEILRDLRTGEPTGIFKDRALDLVGHAIPDPSPAQRDSALARALAYAASLGVAATAHVSASWADLASYRRLEQAGRLTMRVALYLPLDSWRAVAETVSRSGRGDDWVKIGGLKGYMDGSAGSRTAYFFEP